MNMLYLKGGVLDIALAPGRCEPTQLSWLLSNSWVETTTSYSYRTWKSKSHVKAGEAARRVPLVRVFLCFRSCRFGGIWINEETCSNVRLRLQLTSSNCDFSKAKITSLQKESMTAAMCVWWLAGGYILMPRLWTCRTCDLFSTPAARPLWIISWVFGGRAAWKCKNNMSKRQTCNCWWFRNPANRLGMHKTPSKDL